MADAAMDAMAGASLYDGSCAALEALHIVSGRWKLSLLWRLAGGSKRYNELKRCLPGITNTVLTRVLRELEQHDVVERIEQGTAPLQVEYRLSARGEQLVPALEALKEWAVEQAAYERVRGKCFT